MKKKAEKKKTENKRLELIERYAVILGAILGLIAFVWQIFDKVEIKQEKISADLRFYYHVDKPISLQTEVVNISQRPIYIRHIYIEGVSDVIDSRFAVLQHDDPDTEPIQPGASRKYEIQVTIFDEFKKWRDNGNDVFLVVASSLNELIRQDIKECLYDFIGDVETYENDPQKFNEEFYQGSPFDPKDYSGTGDFNNGCNP